MKIWLVTIGEPVPTDEDSPRLHRNGILSEYLLAAGHEVFWWNSTFDHTRKKHRFNRDTTVEIAKGYKIRFLRSTGYISNISVGRKIDHLILALKFYKQAGLTQKPDIILCSMPPVLLTFFAVRFAKKHGIPIVIDLRDKWPDIFADAVPKQFRFIASPFLYPLKSALAWACKNATSLTGMTDKFVEWCILQQTGGAVTTPGANPVPRIKAFPLVTKLSRHQ